MATWASHDEASVLASREAAEWLGEVGATTDGVLAQLEEAYADRASESVTLDELEQSLAASLGSGDPVAAASEQLLGGIVRKAFSAAKGVARAGLAAVAKMVPIGKVFGVLRTFVDPMLRRVLVEATGRLPLAVRPYATRLAGAFGIAEAAHRTPPRPPSSTRRSRRPCCHPRTPPRSCWWPRRSPRWSTCWARTTPWLAWMPLVPDWFESWRRRTRAGHRSSSSSSSSPR